KHMRSEDYDCVEREVTGTAEHTVERPAVASRRQSDNRRRTRREPTRSHTREEPDRSVSVRASQARYSPSQPALRPILLSVLCGHRHSSHNTAGAFSSRETDEQHRPFLCFNRLDECRSYPPQFT